MRVAVFRGMPTINGSDSSEPLVDRLRGLGHQVLHITAVAPPGRAVPEALKRDLVSPEALASFAPQALVVVIPEPTHESFPRALIEEVVRAGGPVVYLGPAGGACPSDAPAVRFLAGRGFYFQSLTPNGPRPIRSRSAPGIRLRPTGPAPVTLDGVHFVDVGTPYVLADQPGQTTLLEVSTDACCTWDGLPVPDGMGLIAAVRASAGLEALMTGEWFTPPSLAALACNLQLIVNLLAAAGPSGAPRPPPGPRPGAALAISADAVSRPFVDLAVERLRTRGYEAAVSLGDGPDLTGRIPGDFCAFVPVIDRTFADRQEREVRAALVAGRNNPDGFRIIPINLRQHLDANREGGVLRKLAGWVWLPGHDSLAWDPLFDTLVRVLGRPTGRFAWRTTVQGRRAFVSYSFRDHGLAARLGERLQECGLDVFLADDTALMNAPLREELTRLIDDCDIFIPLVTTAYRGSNWSFVEAEVATDRFRRTGRPRVLCVAPHGQRVPQWYSGFPVCDDIDAVRTALMAHSILDPHRS